MRKSPRRRLPQEIFVSHASADRRMAQRGAEMLRQHGLPVWYSQTNLLGAQQWRDEIGAALADPIMQARFADLGAEPMQMASTAFNKFIGDETEKWAKVIRAGGIKIE